MKSFLKNIKLHYNIKDYRFSLVILVTILSIIGVFMVRSVMDVDGDGSVTDYSVTLEVNGDGYSYTMPFLGFDISVGWTPYGLNLIMLIAVPIFGTEANGAKRWLNLGFTQFQPSDLTKILMILFFARFLMDRKEKINRPMTLLQAVALILPSLILIYEQPNLSTTICIAALFCALIFLGGLTYRYIVPVIAVIVPAVIILLAIAVQPNQPFLEDYQQKRILAWLDPEEYADDGAYQQLNSVMAIGSGQLSGKGYNNDETTSVKNGNFVSEPQTDFIFAIIGEELGFVGCCVVIFLLLLIVIDCILIGLKAKDTGGRIICGGVASLIGIQSFINIGVATMVLPNTGLSLPFVSYGLTSLVCFFMGIGFVLNVGLQPNKYQ